MNIEKIVQVLPTIMIVESIICAILYLINRDFGRATYWFSASLLTLSITFWIR